MSEKTLERLPPEISALKRPPETLWYRGDPRLLTRPRISVVGTRRPSLYTRHAVERLCAALAKRGVVIVSGAAMGVDALAHRGAGPASTIAVLGTGIDQRYPAINTALIEAIEHEGLLLSRFAPGFGPTRWSFVVRNELVVALGEILVIAEAAIGSGSMRSAEEALRQGKEIWVLPHRIGESEGTQQLLARGRARLIHSIDDFVAQFVKELSEEEHDDFILFCRKNPTLDEALKRYGALVYEAELEGKIEISEGRLRPL